MYKILPLTRNFIRFLLLSLGFLCLCAFTGRVEFRL